ncbi:uncharacterized protein DS421_5g135660 [Arachis hypogaea]|nr:uncharacterized protein DS421_5g135660 [Arachis hypogaea]
MTNEPYRCQDPQRYSLSLHFNQCVFNKHRILLKGKKQPEQESEKCMQRHVINH